MVDLSDFGGCPPLSISVHPWGGHAGRRLAGAQGVKRVVLESVQGVHPPDRPIASRARVCACPLHTMVGSAGWTPWTGFSDARRRTYQRLMREIGCPPLGWTRMDTVDTAGWFAW